MLEDDEESSEWELGSVVSRSTRSSAGSNSFAGSRSDLSSGEETVDDDGTEVGGSIDGETTRSGNEDISVCEAMEVDTAGWNEDAEAPAASMSKWEGAPVLSHAAFTPATSVGTLRRKPLELKKVSYSPRPMYFGPG